MKKIILVLTVVLLLFLSCNEKGQSDSIPEDINDQPETSLEILPEPELAAVPSELPDEPYGLCLVATLNLRSQPSLDGKIVGTLLQNQQVNLLEETSWTETIGGKTSAWYLIENETTEAWAFGAFLDIKGDVPVSGVENLSTAIGSKIFSDVSTVNTAQFPEFRTNLTGYGEPRFLNPDIKGDVIYDSTYNSLYLLIDNAPKDGVKLFLSWSNHSSLSLDYGTQDNEYQLLDHSQFYFAETTNPDVLLPEQIPTLRFVPVPSLENGQLEVTVKDHSDNNIAYGVVTIETLPVSISDKNTLSPLDYNSSRNFTVSEGDRLYIWAKDPDKKDWAYLVLYKYDDSIPAEVLYKPFRAEKVELDQNGLFQGYFNIDAEWEQGTYRFGFGQKVEQPHLMIARFDVN